VTSESEFIASIRSLAADPAARGLLDDAAVLPVGGTTLVLTHDMIVEGVHFLAGDPPGDIAWKLLAVNLSDLAAKGARPLGVLLGYSLSHDAGWDAAFAAGLKSAMNAFGLALLGGDTVSGPQGAPRTFGLTAIGEASGPVPARAGARAGDLLWVTGAIGDAGAGLRVAKSELDGSDGLVERYRLPRPRLEAGQKLAPLVSAMMDVSDGLLIDAARLAEASGLAAGVELDAIPLSADFVAALGDDRAARLAAATAGDDYELLFAIGKDRAAELLSLSESLGLPLSRIGKLRDGAGLSLTDRDGEVPLPGVLGYEHGAGRTQASSDA
jgi:thiamine-monophosphate kinase